MVVGGGCGVCCDDDDDDDNDGGCVNMVRVSGGGRFWFVYMLLE